MKFFSLISCIIVTVLAYEENDRYVIRSTAPNGLVLDGTDSTQVRLQHFTGFSTQLWKFVLGNEPDLHYIVNDHSGKVLDFDKSERDDKKHLVLKDRKENAMEQQWNITCRGRITNAVNDLNIDVAAGKYNAGTRIILWEENGNQAQEFVLQKKV